MYKCNFPLDSTACSEMILSKPWIWQEFFRTRKNEAVPLVVFWRSEDLKFCQHGFLTLMHFAMSLRVHSLTPRVKARCPHSVLTRFFFFFFLPGKQWIELASIYWEKKTVKATYRLLSCLNVYFLKDKLRQLWLDKSGLSFYNWFLNSGTKCTW